MKGLLTDKVGVTDNRSKPPIINTSNIHSGYIVLGSVDSVLYVVCGFQPGFMKLTYFAVEANLL